jgi:hypothetical protein
MGGGLRQMRRAEPFGCIALIAALCASATICCAQYRVLQGKLDADGLPTTPARICLGTSGTDHCFTPPSDKYAFGLEPRAHTIAKLNGNDLILFTATFSGGGSGELTNLALLEERTGEFVNLLPVVQLTNQGEYQVWSLPQISSLPVLTTADFVWDFKAQETNFAPHRYSVYAYAFDPKTRRYLERAHYLTAKKYTGLDDSDSIRVLNAEKPAIVARLSRIPAH